MRVYPNFDVYVSKKGTLPPSCPSTAPSCPSSALPPKPKRVVVVKPKSREIGTKLFVLFLMSLLSIPLGFTIYSIPVTFVILVVACWIGGYFAAD
jgi:hypothetical protein